MKRDSFHKRPHTEGEGFVWISFSDLLLTLLMTFIVLAIWSVKESQSRPNEAEVKAGKECLAQREKDKTDMEDGKSCLARESKDKEQFETKQKALERVYSEVIKKVKFQTECKSAKIELNGNQGFRVIYSEGGGLAWFRESSAKLEGDSKSCLTKVGEVWLDAIERENLSSDVRQLLIEGHANSRRFVTSKNDNDNFLMNLNLSQERAFSASKHLLESLDGKMLQQKPIRSMIVAQGKSYLEPIKKNDGSEDTESSKRLEFKIILKNLPIVAAGSYGE